MAFVIYNNNSSVYAAAMLLWRCTETSDAEQFGPKTFRTQAHFGTIRLFPKCPDSSAPVPKCPRNISALLPKCIDFHQAFFLLCGSGKCMSHMRICGSYRKFVSGLRTLKPKAISRNIPRRLNLEVILNKSHLRICASSCLLYTSPSPRDS